MDPSQFPARFVLAGVLLNVFKKPSGTTRDGKPFGNDHALQLMSCDHLRNGEKKLIPTDVSIGEEEAQAATFRKLVGKVVKLPVSVYAIGGELRVSLADKGFVPASAAAPAAAAAGGAA